MTRSSEISSDRPVQIASGVADVTTRMFSWRASSIFNRQAATRSRNWSQVSPPIGITTGEPCLYHFGIARHPSAMYSCRVRALANANLLAHLVVFVQKFRIFGCQERSNLAIHSPEIEFIPSRIDANCGEANLRVGIGRTNLPGGLLLPRQCSSIGGGKSGSL